MTVKIEVVANYKVLPDKHMTAERLNQKIIIFPGSIKDSETRIFRKLEKPINPDCILPPRLILEEALIQEVSKFLNQEEKTEFQRKPEYYLQFFICLQTPNYAQVILNQEGLEDLETILAKSQDEQGIDNFLRMSNTVMNIQTASAFLKHIINAVLNPLTE
ncbi:MAG: hypothetical protein ABI425_00245 [Patescibacteria group bacterium]